MKSQVYVMFKQAQDPSLLYADKIPVWNESGLADGMVVNCDSDDALLNTLKFLAEQGHIAQVKMLADDEEFPVRQDWLNAAEK